jgi:peptidoglycan/xylan/chitin deacetylase (PgdA/CDA1 family)
VPTEFESDDFIVVFARANDTAESVATRHLQNPAKAWMIEEFCQATSFAAGQKVVIPKRDWNPPGVYPDGYQLVPVLVYHHIGPKRKERLLIAASTFEEQMQHLKREGYRAIRLEDFIGYLLDRRQLPKKSVLLTFDDGYKSFLTYADPLLRKLGFTATLFIQSDQIPARPSPNSSHLSWPELRDLVKDGFEVQSHSKTHSDLRRTAKESEAGYALRMQAELAYSLSLFRTELSRAADAIESIAYPFGDCDENCRRHVKKHGYTVGFTVDRAANAAFEPLLEVNRSQVYAEWTLDEFKKNLNTFQPESILPPTTPAEIPPPCPVPSSPASSRRQLAASHRDRSQALADRGWLRQALDESRIALTIDPDDPASQERQKGLEARIENEVTARVQQGLALAHTSPPEARRSLLAALALDPTSQAAFEALRNAPPPAAFRFVTHAVRKGDTTSSLALLYYNDRSRSENIERANGLKPGEAPTIGRALRIPKIPGVAILPLP